MAWEYLPEVDYRLWVVAGYLKDRLRAGDVVLDLDACEGRIRPMLREDIEYYANDLTPIHPRVMKKTDDEMVEFMKDRGCDVLICVGYSGYELRPNVKESPTLTSSIVDLIKQHKPRIVILETVFKYRDAMLRLLDIDQWAFNDYVVDVDVNIEPMKFQPFIEPSEPHRWKYTRNVICLRRKEVANG